MDFKLEEPLQTLEDDDILLTQEITLQLQEKVSSELRVIGNYFSKLLLYKKQLISEIRLLKEHKRDGGQVIVDGNVYSLRQFLQYFQFLEEMDFRSDLDLASALNLKS